MEIVHSKSSARVKVWTLRVRNSPVDFSPYRQKEGGNVRAVQKLRREVEAAKRYMSQENVDQLTLFILSLDGKDAPVPHNRCV